MSGEVKRIDLVVTVVVCGAALADVVAVVACLVS